MLVVGNGKLITRNNDLPYIENGAVAIEGTKISEIGTTKEIREKYKDAEYIELLAKIDFSYEVDFGTSTTSIESKYLPSLTDFIAQSLSQQLNCDIITSFKPLSGDEFCPITYFSKGKEVINFTTFNSNCWDGVCWVKKRRQTNIR